MLHSRQAELTRVKEQRQTVANNLGGRVQKLRVKLEHTAVAAAGKEKEAADATARLRALQQRAESGEGAAVDETALSRLKQARDLPASRSYHKLLSPSLISSRLLSPSVTFSHVLSPHAYATRACLECAIAGSQRP